MTFNLKRIHEILFFAALFILIPLWNIPHTIAGRYTCEGLLLITVLLYKPEWKLFFQRNRVLLAFFVYLILQLVFFSENFKLAFSNFRAEWMHFILFSIIGAGVGLILGKNDSKKFLLYFGIAFSVPLFIHIILFLVKAVTSGKIPWGYWGINEIHGDFAYPALEASILFCTYYFVQAKTNKERYLTGGLIVVCILSPLIATSRGGVIFTLAGILFVIFSHLFIGTGKSLSARKKILFILALPFFIWGIYKVGVVSDPNRWTGITSRLAISLEGNPRQVYCEGIETLEDVLKEKGVEITPEIQKGLNSVVDGEGSRVMAARSSFALMLQNPMGINQSKQAYQQAIKTYCGSSPKIFIAHAHDAWIDTALAIGIPGAILLLLVLIHYGRFGYLAYIKHSQSSPYGLALFASSCMWIARGLLDSTMRDQMLEMQAFIFATMMAMIIAQNSTKSRIK